MAASITVPLQILKRPLLLLFSTDLVETGIKIHGLLRYFKYNIVIIRVAVPFNIFDSFKNGSFKGKFHLYCKLLNQNRPPSLYFKALNTGCKSHWDS